jgi:PhnB protein
MTSGIPEGRHSVTPRLVVHEPAKLVEFLKRAFGATGDLHTDKPCQIRIGDSIVMVSDDTVREAMPAFLYLYVADADIVYERALRRLSLTCTDQTR